MATAEGTLRRLLPSVDVLWEVADARCPVASRNRRLVHLVGGKPRLLVLARPDRADPGVTADWVRGLAADQPTLAMDLRQPRPSDIAALWAQSRQAIARAGGSVPPLGRLKAMVAGVPNTGKSTLLNRASGGRHLAVADRPGVTRGEQWLHSAEEGMLLDLPGVLPTRLGPWPVAWRLWAVGVVAVDAVDPEMGASELLGWIAERSPMGLTTRYALEPGEPQAMLAVIAARCGLLRAGGRPDTGAAAQRVRSDFGKGLLGRISLEVPGGEPRGEIGGPAGTGATGAQGAAPAL